jgi:hypothetical protein
MFISIRAVTRNQYKFAHIMLPKITSQFAKFNEFNTIIQLKDIISWGVTLCSGLKVNRSEILFHAGFLLGLFFEP